MITKFKEQDEQGQGLVEYGLILILVSISAVVLMGLLGDQLGDVFQSVTGAISSGPITSVTAERTGNGNGNDVVITVTVSEPATVTATDSQSGKTTTASCSNTCTLTIAGVGPSSGTITAEAKLGSRVAGYEAKGS